MFHWHVLFLLRKLVLYLELTQEIIVNPFLPELHCMKGTATYHKLDVVLLYSPQGSLRNNIDISKGNDYFKTYMHNCLEIRNVQNSFSSLSKPGIQTRNKTKQLIWHAHTSLSFWKQILEQSQQNGDKTCYQTRDADSWIAIVALAAVDVAFGYRFSGGF